MKKKTVLLRTANETAIIPIDHGNYFYRNKEVDALRIAFPQTAYMWTVDEYYPSTKTFVDRPRTQDEKERISLKISVMKDAQLKYEVEK